MISADTTELRLPSIQHVQARWPILWARAIRISWPLVALAVAIVASGCLAGPFSYASAFETAQRVAIVGAFLAGAIVFALNERPRGALMMEGFALTMAVALTVPGITTMIAALDVPYQDAALLAADKALGFDWQAIVEWVRAHPTLSILLSHVYSSLLWQPALLVPALAYCDPERFRRVMGTSTLALVTTVAIFALVPAETGYVHLGYRRSDFPDMLANTSWGVAHILNGVRAGDRQLYLEGLITFPSYHAVAAALFAYAWLAVPVVRWPFFALNVVMLFACVPIGSHYVVDVIGGLILAAAAYRFVDRYHARTDTEPALKLWRETPEGQALLRSAAKLRTRCLGRWVRQASQ